MYTQQKLTQIVEGMEVYDKDAARIGTVKSFHYGEGTAKTSEIDIVTIAERVSDLLGTNKSLPTVLYSRLYDQGFVCVDRGFLRSDAIVFPDQIEDYGEYAVFLNVEANELMKV
jgi:hypothetical protein